jgi:hypothetical protein
VSSIGDDFKRVNDAAIRKPARMGAALLPAARPCARRLSRELADLGRDLEEDLSILTEGIVDWGLHDQGERATAGARRSIW